MTDQNYFKNSLKSRKTKGIVNLIEIFMNDIKMLKQPVIATSYYFWQFFK
jgi:hypothetical protein